MKAVVYDRYGGPEVLEYRDVADPKLAQNSVLIRVRAAAVNPADIALRAGLGEAHTAAWFPVIPGWDVAGVIEAKGPGVAEFEIGDEVLAYMREEILHYGAYAELTAVPAQLVVKKPHRASWGGGRRAAPGGIDGLSRGCSNAQNHRAGHSSYSWRQWQCRFPRRAAGLIERRPCYRRGISAQSRFPEVLECRTGQLWR